MLRYLIEKEFKQFRRNAFLPRLVIMFPVMIMLVMPWVATLDISDIKVSIVDHDHSSLSRRLTHQIAASDYFILQPLAPSHDAALTDLESDRADLILSIPCDFERQIQRNEPSEVLIEVNAVNGTKGSLGGNYMASIIQEFHRSVLSEQGASLDAPVHLSVRNLYNPTLNYRYFMIPALVAVLVIMLCGFLPALNIVSEKEIGTIEQINVTPVGKFQFIFAKLVPYWTIGFVVLTLCFLLAYWVYHYTPEGSFGVIYAATALFILAISSFGLIISNHSQTMQQAMLVMFFFMLIFTLMSGLFTPVRSMPDWAQWISVFIPPRYFIEVMRGVYQRGSGFTDLWRQFAALGGFDLVLGLVAVLSYRKRN
ncbi:MAG: ABC transporter permease [Alistipes sp.]|nr:ABC transporter permease [Alistipes sp.]